ncbi:MAG: copper amine oxidase N-terminal domain-containing protein [Ruminococcaceae bacterium]|nr:copper amine oxidase N-terminal domain-containing protein [Oscillospiraceae bacterium]
MKKSVFCGMLCFIICVLLLQPVGAESFSYRIYRENDWIFFEHRRPFLNENGRTMVPLCYAHELFQGGFSWKIERDRVIFHQKGWEYENTVTIQIGSPILNRNGEIVTMDSVPVIQNNEIYFPLRAVAEALNHEIICHNDSKQIYLYHYSAFLFLWNENEDSSPEGMRYAIFQDMPENNQNEIMSEGLTNFDRLYELLALVPGKVQAHLYYPLEGHKLSQEIWNQITEKAPVTEKEISLEDHPMTNNLGQKSLEQYGTHCYRVTIVHPYRIPSFFRMEIQSDGTGMLYRDIHNRRISPFGGDAVESKQTELSKEQVNEFLDKLEEMNFWELEETIDRTGYDGYEVYFEGLFQGAYHTIYRWCPEENDSISLLIQHLRELLNKN